MEKQITILIEGAGTATAISVLKGLSRIKDTKVKTIITDVDPWSSGRYLADVFEIVPSSKDPMYVDAVYDLCKKYEVDIYIPIIDYGFDQLSKNKERFLDIGTSLIISDPETIEITQDKWKTRQFFKQNNIPTPSTWLEKEEVQLPAIVKPRTEGRASIDAHMVETEEQLFFYANKLENPIFQTYITGQEFTADSLSDLAGNTFIESVVRARVETKGGVSTKASVITGEVADTIKKYIKQTVETLHIPGVCNIQGFVREDGTIIFTEINPRFAGTHAFTIEVGLNSIAEIIALHSGASADDIQSHIQIDSNKKMVRYWNEIFFDNDTVSTWDNLFQQ